MLFKIQIAIVQFFQTETKEFHDGYDDHMAYGQK